MRLRKLATTAIIGLVVAPLAACSSSSKTASPSTSSGTSTTASAAAGGSSAPAKSTGVTLNYWASNQGTSLANDQQILTPELNKFTAQTGIKVNLQVVPWSDLLNNILAATTSGQGPDVLNIGNTWSPSLQATNAFTPFDTSTIGQVGGASHFLAGSLSATGAPGQPPVAVPLYSLAYGLYYNKAQFAAAGITSPPSTWDEFEADAKKLTTPSHWGLALEAGSVSETIHSIFTLGQQQGGSFYDSSGKPTFDTPQNVAGIMQYINFMQTDKIVNPSDAEYSQGTEALKDFATGKVSMLFWQASQGSLIQLGMNPADIGVAPVPLPATLPAGGKKITSMVAGINLAIFKDSKNQAADLQFVKFMTSTPEQIILNKTYGSLPSVGAAYADPAFQTPQVKVFQDVLATSAAPLPPVASESQFETLVGTAVNKLFANVATGQTVTSDQVASALQAAQQQITTS